jgi:hypothetical protein
MGVPDIPCTAVSVSPTGLCITLPGAATVCLSFPSSGLASAMAATKAMLGHVNVALAPLMPFFKIIDAIDKAKTLLFSPDQFFAALLELAGMVPALTVPVMVADALDILILYLQGLYSQLQAFVTQQAAIAAAATKAATLGCTPLALTVDCATAQLVLQMQGVNDGVAPLNALVATMNLVLGLVPGAPTIPNFSDLGPDPAAALAPLAATIAALQAIRALPFFPP